MHNTLRQQLLTIIENSRPLVEAIKRKDRDLASQLGRALRALNSIGLNVAEGFGCGAGNARLRFQSAHGSLYEAQAALRLAAAWGHIDKASCARVVQSLDALVDGFSGFGAARLKARHSYAARTLLGLRRIRLAYWHGLAISRARTIDPNPDLS